MDRARPDNTAGMTVVAAAAVALLAGLWRRVRRCAREKVADSAGASH